MKTKAKYVAVVLGVMLAGCASRSAIRPVTDSTTRLQYYGFSVLPPPGSHWYFSGEGKYGVGFGKGDPEKYKERSDLTHTFVVAVSNLEYFDEKGVWEVDSPEKLEEAADNLLQAQSRGRFRLIESELISYRTQGTDCVRFQAVYEEQRNPSAPGVVLIINDQGFYCRHPDSAKRMVHAIRSERFVQGEKTFLDESLQREVEEFFESVEFTPLH